MPVPVIVLVCVKDSEVSHDASVSCDVWTFYLFSVAPLLLSVQMSERG